MTPLQTALHLTAEKGEDFWATVMVSLHQGGHFYATPDFVLLAQRESEDTLFIWCAIGSGYLPKLVALAPPGTKWLKWWRSLRVDDPARVVQYPFERVQRLVAQSPHAQTQDARRRQCPAARDGAVGELAGS